MSSSSDGTCTRQTWCQIFFKKWDLLGKLFGTHRDEFNSSCFLINNRSHWYIKLLRHCVDPKCQSTTIVRWKSHFLPWRRVLGRDGRRRNMAECLQGLHRRGPVLHRTSWTSPWHCSTQRKIRTFRISWTQDDASYRRPFDINPKSIAGTESSMC